VKLRYDELSEAIRAYAALGFDVTRGGEHPGWGTENALKGQRA
jgi:hypothetical protein